MEAAARDIAARAAAAETHTTWGGDDALATLREAFEEAVEHINNSSTATLSEETQRRLFGLFHRATGTAVARLQADAEQAAALRSVSKLTPMEAMREYVELVTASDSSFLFAEDAEAAPDLSPTVGMHVSTSGGAAGDAAAAASASADIFEAARSAADSLATFLRESPDETGAVDEDGLTALHHAVDAEHLEATRLLLAAHADPNALDASSSTPLHYAALLGSDELVHALLRAGADATLIDGDGQTAAALAQAEGHADLAKTLQDAPPPSAAGAGGAAAATS